MTDPKEMRLLRQKMNEEKKDEMKNRISMALKDPILQQEFEIICKNLAELKKENAELKSECRTCVYTDSPCVLSDYPSKNGVCSHYKNAFEENAELKEKYRKRGEVICRLEKQIRLYIHSDNLTKAKKIIKGSIVLLTKPRTALDTKTYLMKAEQFLRETDIDNAIQKANEGLDLDKIAEEVEDDLKEGCPDVLCEGCTEEDCTARKLGLIC